jgi:polyhydroxybutyrate depolymerase
MMKFSRVFLVSIVVLLITGAVFMARADTEEYTLEVDHSPRTFLVHVPKNIKHPAPLVIALHGGASNGKTMERFSGLSEAADKYGFIVAYPDGSGRLKRVLTWNSGKCCGYAQEKNIDDVAFIRVLIGHLIKRFSVDPSRVYIAGMSNGAMMSYRLAAEIPDQIAAIAAVSGTLDIDPSLVRAPVPILHFHGTEDQYVPFEGGRGTRTLDKSRHTSVMDTIKIWVDVNGTTTTPMVEELPDRYEDGTRIVRYSYKPIHNDADIILYKIIGGGHTWPGQPHMKLILGTTTKEISANDVMWKFFSAHDKRSAGKDKTNHTHKWNKGPDM